MEAILLSDLPGFRHDHENHKIPLGQVVRLSTEGGNEWAFGDVVRSNFYADHFDEPGFKGKVYRDRKHIGAGVFVDDGERFQEICLGIKGQLKMIVVGYHRDCDGTPLYILSFKPVGFPTGRYTIYDRETRQSTYPYEGRSDMLMGMRYNMWLGLYINGISEGSLEVVQDEFVPLTCEDVYEYEQKVFGG